MSKEKIQALIDRVIGKKGILRAPSWWFRRLLLQLLDYIEVSVQNVKIQIDAEMSDTSENVVSNNVIKTYVDEQVKPLSDSIKNITSEMISNEKVTASALVDLNIRINEIKARLDAGGL